MKNIILNALVSRKTKLLSIVHNRAHIDDRFRVPRIDDIV